MRFGPSWPIRRHFTSLGRSGIGRVLIGDNHDIWMVDDRSYRWDDMSVELLEKFSQPSVVLFDARGRGGAEF